MNTVLLRRIQVVVLAMSLVTLAANPVAVGGQAPSKKRPKIKKTKRNVPAQPLPPRVHADGPRKRQSRPGKVYLKTRPRYRHVRLTRAPRHHDGKLDVRTIITSCASAKSLDRHHFEDHRREQVRRVVRLLREGRRERAMEIWGLFVNDLADYHDPVDLDELILYVVREGCARENTAGALRALQLDHLRRTELQLEDYLHRLHEHRDVCAHPGRQCSGEIMRILETDIARTRADLEIVQISKRYANSMFESVADHDHDYERRFAITFNGLYHEIELRIGHDH